jgi:hypothetical protein
VSRTDTGNDYTAIEIAEMAEGASPKTTSISDNILTGTDRNDIIVDDLNNDGAVNTTLEIAGNTIQVADAKEEVGILL